MYQNAKQLLTLCKEQGKRIFDIAAETEMQQTGQSKENILRYFDGCLNVMYDSARRALEKSIPTTGSLIKGVASTQFSYSKGVTVTGSFLNYVMALAYSSSETNASMGKICASPTAGSCGILPAVLLSISERDKISREKTIEALITAGAVGALYTRNATVAGAEGGCQAECGVASSMAAAAACYMLGADDLTCLNAAGFAMINVMGLICDPVAGLVQIPCAQRNASGAVNALISADLALAGQPAHIPFDDIVEAMYQVGKMLPPQLRETAKGGLAATPSGQAILKSFLLSR